MSYFPYMAGSADPGNYELAFAVARKKFAGRLPADIASAAGVFFDHQNSVFIVPSFGTELIVTYPDGNVCFRADGTPPLVGWRLITINYLARAGGNSLQEHPISYRDLEDGNLFYPAFYREAIQKLIQWLPGKSLDMIKKAVLELGAENREGADLAFVFAAFPRFPITLKIWLPDDELPASANITFDSTANHYLHTEDIAVLGWYLTAFIIKHHELLVSGNTAPKILP